MYAVDLQPEMLNKLREKLAGPDAPRNIELVRGAASKTTLPSMCADFVFVANVWHEVEDHAAALQEAARILAPGALSLCWIGARILAHRQALPQIIASQRLVCCNFS